MPLQTQNFVNLIHLVLFDIEVITYLKMFKVNIVLPFNRYQCLFRNKNVLCFWVN